MPTPAPARHDNPSPTRRRRHWRTILLAAAVLLIGLALGVYFYLSSAAAARLVSSKLSEALGTTVRINGLEPGLGSTGLSNIEIEEAGGANEGKPWLSVQRLSADASLVGLAKGEMPDHVTLREAKVTLRFDAQGKLLTRLPQPKQNGGTAKVPALRLEQSELTILQDGHPPSAFAGINLDLTEQKGKLQCKGQFQDKAWGHWSLESVIDAASGAGNASLKTLESVSVTPELLKNVPLVRPAVWNAVSITGETTAQITFDFRPRDDWFDYLVKAQPEHSSVTIPAIALTTTDTSGSVTVKDSVVTLENVKGQSASGTVDVDGVLNFHDEPNHLDLHVVAHKLNVERLPEKWWMSRSRPGQKILPQFFLRSDLNGDARLKLIFAKPGTRYEGSGAATLRLRDYTAAQADPIHLQLKAHEKGFEFEQKTGEPMSQKSQPAREHRASPDPRIIPTVALLANLFAAQNRAPKDPAPADKAPAAKAEKNYIDINIALHDVDLAELVKKLEVNPPFPISGRITVKVKASIPTDTTTDMKSYRLVGTAELPQLTIEDMTLENVLAKVIYRDGKLNLEDFKAKVPDATNPKVSGSFKGVASLGLIPSGELTAKLDLDQLPIDQLMRIFPDLAKGAEGNFSGHLDLKAPAGQLSNPALWTGNARLEADRARALGWAIRKLKVQAKLADGKLVLNPLSGDIEGAALEVTGDLKLIDRYAFKTHIQLSKVDLAALDKLSPQMKPAVALAGVFEAEAEVSGDLKPFAIHAGGKGSVTHLEVETFPIEKLSFRWDLDKDHLKISDFSSHLFGGDITGSAEVPLRNQDAGGINLKMKDVNLTELSKKTRSLEGLKFEGTAEGDLKATIPAVKANETRAVIADLDIQAAKLKVRNIPADHLHAKAEYRRGTVNYKVEASAFGGTIELDGKYPPKQTKEPAEQKGESQQGRLHIQGVQLGRLWPVFGIEKTMAEISGKVSLDLPFHYDNRGQPEGAGSLQIKELRYKDRELTPLIETTAKLSADAIRLEKIDSIIGGGVLSGSATVHFVDSKSSKANISMRGVSSDALLFSFPDLAQQVKTRVDVQMEATLGRHMRGRGVIASTDGKWLNYDINTVRIPIEWDLVPAQRRGEISIRDLTAEIAQGRISGHATYQLSGESGGQTEGNLAFRDVNVPSLVSTSRDLSTYGVGRATGNFEFAGKNVKSLNDLNGKLTATLGKSHLSGIPVLRNVLPFLGSSGQTAQRSDIRASLTGGTWHVERLALLGRNLQIFATGTVTNEGRLNLNMNANTGQLNPASLGLGVLAARLPSGIGAFPLSVMTRLSTAVTSLTVNLSVTGTLANPTVRVKPIGTLKEEALRFFLNQNELPSS